MENKQNRIVMARLVKRIDGDRLFDTEFWEKIAPDQRFAVACSMVFDVELLRGKRVYQSGLVRTIQNIIRRKG
jgi:hypothetical protein